MIDIVDDLPTDSLTLLAAAVTSTRELSRDRRNGTPAFAGCRAGTAEKPGVREGYEAGRDDWLTAGGGLSG